MKKTQIPVPGKGIDFKGLLAIELPKSKGRPLQTIAIEYDGMLREGNNIAIIVNSMELAELIKNGPLMDPMKREALKMVIGITEREEVK